MKRSFVSHLLAFVVISNIVVISSIAYAQNIDELSAVENAISSLHLKKAEDLLKNMPKSSSQSPRGKFIGGKLLFFNGKYIEALEALREAIEAVKTELEWKQFRDRIALSHNVIKKLTSTTTANGQFTFWHDKGIDSILIPSAQRTLTAQLQSLEKVFSEKANLPIQVLLLSSVEDMSDVTGLSVERIETTGTVGVSKYGRIMILSPRLIVNGYPWLDTLAHELTHLYITKVSKNEAPIWLHEGIAKLLERRWRGEKKGNLSPEEAYLLDRAIHEKRLIPFRRFHPSVSHLPNQEDAALAYAQVLSFMIYLDKKIKVSNWLKILLQSLANGNTMDESFVKLFKFTTRRLYLWWEQTTSGKRLTPVSIIGLMKKRFQRGAATGQIQNESLLNIHVLRHIRLGDLLRLRGHIKPAAIEYKRALTLNETGTPEITSRLADCLLDLKKYDDVIKLLTPMAQLYPFDAMIFIQLGIATTFLNKPDQSIKFLEHAKSINPFNKQIHCVLFDNFTKIGDSQKAKIEKRHCLLLGSQLPDKHSATQ